MGENSQNDSMFVEPASCTLMHPLKCKIFFKSNSEPKFFGFSKTIRMAEIALALALHRDVLVLLNFLAMPFKLDVRAEEEECCNFCDESNI